MLWTLLVGIWFASCATDVMVFKVPLSLNCGYLRTMISVPYRVWTPGARSRKTCAAEHDQHLSPLGAIYPYRSGYFLSLPVIAMTGPVVQFFDQSLVLNDWCLTTLIAPMKYGDLTGCTLHASTNRPSIFLFFCLVIYIILRRIKKDGSESHLLGINMEEIQARFCSGLRSCSLRISISIQVFVS